MDQLESEAASKLRSLGMEDVDELLDAERMPMTTEELIEEFGDREVRYPRGSDRIEHILRTSGMETYETVDELQLAILNGVGRDAVGRPRYSDRGDENIEDLDRTARSF